MRDHRGDSWIAARRATGYRDKTRQFVVRAPVKFHYRCSRELTWLASGMATKAEICVMLYDPAGPTGEGSAPSVAAGMITPTAVVLRIIGLFLQMQAAFIYSCQTHALGGQT